MVDRPRYTKSHSKERRKPRGFYAAEVTRVEDPDVYVKVPRLTYEFEHGPIAYVGDLPEVDSDTLVGFVHGDQDQPVGIFPGSGAGTGPIETSFYIAASNAPDEHKAVADYVCDGVEDEIEIQAAFDTGSNLRVVLSEGEFYLKNHFVFDNATLEGSGHGTILNFLGDATESLYTYQLGIGMENGAVMRDLTIDVGLFVGGRMNVVDAGGGYSTQPAWKSSNAWHQGCVIENVRFEGLDGIDSTPAPNDTAGVRAFYIDAYDGVLIQNCVFNGLGYYDNHGGRPTTFPRVYGVYAYYTAFRNCTFNGNGYSYAVWMDDQSLVDNCQFNEATALIPAARSAKIVNSRFNITKDNDAGIMTSGPAGVIISNNTFHNNGIYATESTDTVAGIQVNEYEWASFQGLSYASITNNHFHRCSYDVHHNGYDRYVLFDNNTMYESAGVRIGLDHVASSSSGSYVDCSISNNTISGYSTWRTGILVAGGTDDYLIDGIRIHNNNIISNAPWPNHIIDMFTGENQGDHEGGSIAGNTITSTSTAPPLGINVLFDTTITAPSGGERAIFIQNNNLYGTFGIVSNGGEQAYVDKNTLGLYDWDAATPSGSNRIEVTGGSLSLATITNNYVATGIPTSTTEAIKVEAATGGAVLRNSIVAHGDPPSDAGAYITADGNFYIHDNRCYGTGYAETNLTDWASYGNVDPPNDGITIVADSGGVLGYNSIKSTESNPATVVNDTATRDMFRNIRQITFTFKGTLTVNDVSPRLYFDERAQIISAQALCGTAPTGADVIVDLQLGTNISKSTMYPTNTGNRPTVAAGQTASDMEITPDTSVITSGQYLQLELLQVGSTVAGADMTVTVYWIPDGGYCPPELPDDAG